MEGNHMPFSLIRFPLIPKGGVNGFYYTKLDEGWWYYSVAVTVTSHFCLAPSKIPDPTETRTRGVVRVGSLRPHDNGDSVPVRDTQIKSDRRWIE